MYLLIIYNCQLKKKNPRKLHMIEGQYLHTYFFHFLNPTTQYSISVMFILFLSKYFKFSTLTRLFIILNIIWIMLLYVYHFLLLLHTIMHICSSILIIVLTDKFSFIYATDNVSQSGLHHQ